MWRVQIMFCVTWICSETEAFCVSWTQSERLSWRSRLPASLPVPHSLRLLNCLWCYFVLARSTTHLDLWMLFCWDWFRDLFKASLELSRCGRNLFALQVISDGQVLSHNILVTRKKGLFLNRHKINVNEFLAHIKFHFIHKNSGNSTGS